MTYSHYIRLGADMIISRLCKGLGVFTHLQIGIKSCQAVRLRSFTLLFKFFAAW